MIKSVNSQTISEAAEILKCGGLVGMPTETVYGLAANALDGQAVAKIFAAKGRPSFNPLIIHVPDLAAAENYVEVNDLARAAAHVFWPGPLTLILPRLRQGFGGQAQAGCTISELASAGLDTLAVRVPAHPVALDLLKACGLPLAAPSANKSGTLSPTSPAHVHESLGAAVDLILAAGACRVGLESTVLDLSGAQPEILRPGAVNAEELAEVLGVDVVYAQGDTDKPKSPGLLLKHYAPRLPVRLNAVDLEAGEALLAFGSDKFMGVKGGGAAKDLPEGWRMNLSENQDLDEAAANLFAMLKALDQSGARGIAVMAVPDAGIGRAINDRLKRAAAAQK
ncbi:MAG: threonylcarbamoyl-AMP synthase [Alphaproteobacteria bacterium]|nr:threonylcarbamoyl-AMP synthase [Alphaproteobacteria bacterium]